MPGFTLAQAPRRSAAPRYGKVAPPPVIGPLGVVGLNLLASTTMGAAAELTGLGMLSVLFAVTFGGAALTLTLLALLLRLNDPGDDA